MKLCVDDNNRKCLTNLCCFIANKINEIRYNAQTLTVIGELFHDGSLLRQSYFFIAILLACFGLINNMISLMVFKRDYIRFTVIGIYLIMFSLSGLIMMSLFLINIILNFQYDGYSFRLWTCHFYPYLFLIMSNTNILMSAGIAIESIMYRCFSFDRFRSRKSALSIIFILMFFISISNLDKIFARHLILNRSNQFSCTYNNYIYPIWFDINKFTSYSFILIACLIHITCILLLFFKMKQQKQKYWQKILLYQDILLPSFLIILCSMPYVFFRYSLNTYNLLSNRIDMHFHMGLILCVNIPQMLTFFIYILPNKYYGNEFQRSSIYQRLLCNCRSNKQVQIQEFEMEYKTWQQRTALEPIMTISSLNDYYVGGEIYDRIKLEV
ncbi:hypothetical protein I4U23_026165 [Adineta vaga]|nr:hypothetical protein I4U23_026165 [Adineta vaga]